MTLPVTLATTYLAVNLALMAWLVREEAHGRVPPTRMVVLSRAIRWGPPLLGLLYLITIAQDWPFVLFVGTFFAGAFWLLDGFLSDATRPPKR